MSAIRRFYAGNIDNSIFRFTIDTRNIVSGATNGSQLDKQFILPIDTGFGSSFILKVSDGRSDVIVNSNNISTYKTITFATAGIYEITLIGKANIRFNNMSPDAKKMTLVSEFGLGFKFSTYALQDAINMIWDVPFVRFNELNRVFIGIKGFGSNADLSKYIIDSATVATYTFSSIINPMTSVLSGFFPMLTNAQDFYRDAPLASVPEVQIIAPKLTTVSGAFYSSNMRGRIVIQSEVLTIMDSLCRGYTSPPSLGEVDIRRVTSASFFINSVMSTANVNATLLGWANNFDWSKIPTIANKVTLDFFNSKYSNNQAVIAAKTFLESKGITFTRLTMA